VLCVVRERPWYSRPSGWLLASSITGVVMTALPAALVFAGALDRVKLALFASPRMV